MIYIGLAIGTAWGMFSAWLFNHHKKKRYHFVPRYKDPEQDRKLAERLKKIEEEIFEFENGTDP